MTTANVSPAGELADETWLAELEQHWVRTQLGLVNVRVGGRADGTPLVCWPSLFMDGTMWRYQFEFFAARYRLVLIDSPGHGQSDALRRLIDLKDSADVLVEVLDALAIEKAVVMGNSWGGMLATVAPAYYPERTLAAIAINATASLPTTVESVWATALSSYLSMCSRMPGFTYKLAVHLFTGPTARAARPEFLEFLHYPERDDPKSVSWALRSILIGRRDEHRLLSTIGDIPVLVIAGEEDSQFPVHAVRKMADAIPHSRFEVITHTGHLAARENPDAVNVLVDDFLTGIAGQLTDTASRS
jgi:3-oxoadipate enol-lactonase